VGPLPKRFNFGRGRYLNVDEPEPVTVKAPNVLLMHAPFAAVPFALATLVVPLNWPEMTLVVSWRIAG